MYESVYTIHIYRYMKGGNDMAKAIIIRNFPGDLHHRAKVQAAKEATTLKEIVIKALEQYLKKVGG